MAKSAWWFLLPLVLGIVGSAIAWSKLSDEEDKEMLKWIMIFGSVQTVALAISSLSSFPGTGYF